MAAPIPIFIFLLPLVFFINILSFFSALTLSSSLSFNFTSFDSSNTHIFYERAFPSNRTIKLTGERVNSNQNFSGRATYFKPLHLWDKASGNLSSFRTHFSFAIDSEGAERYGDGLTFFFAPNNSRLDDEISKGSGLGIGFNPSLTNLTYSSFFAVEFDIFSNYFDPPEKLEHVGIDINSMASVAYSVWKCDIRRGKRTDVWINYDSVTLNLSVTFTGYDENNKTILQKLNHDVNFRLTLPEWVTFGFSAATGSLYATHNIYSWDFESTLNLASDSNLPSSPGKGSKVGLVVGVGVGVGVLFLGGGLVIVWIFFWKKRKKKMMKMNMEEDMVLDDSEFEKGKGPQKFTYSELAQATNNFWEGEKLGEGGFGGVYRGFLRDLNCYVAVKKVSKGSRQGLKEYASEVKIISQLRHRNLVQLLGWCHERGELLLVYEFMSNGSLDAHLFKENNFLTWEFRYKVARGIASALLYLHEEWEKCVLHRDIKSSNVMLDSDFNAKLGDFGLARLVDHAIGSQTTVLAGTMGYLAPECATTGRASKESDVFSFGIVALEIACGRRPFNPNVEEDKMVMVEWVWKLYGHGRLLEAADSKLHGSLEDEPQQQQQIECLMVVGLWCAHPDINCRPSIRQAIHVLNFEAPLPVLPLQFPTLAYHPLSVNRSTISSSFSSTQDSVVSQTGKGFNSTNVLTSSSQETTSSSTSFSASTSLLNTR